MNENVVLGALSASPPSVNFASVPLGQTNSQPITLTNTGLANVEILRSTVAGASFKLTGLASSTVIAPGASVTFNVTFRASSAATFTATASIYSNASNSPLAVDLSGTGAAASLQLATSPSSLGFGSVTVGASSSLNISLTNSGNSNLTISKVTTPSAVLTTSGVSAGLILGPSQTATLDVTFLPTSAASISGSISITSNASTAPVKIPVTGSGVQASAQSVSLNWVASSTPGVIGYDVYRSTVSGGPYNVVTSSPVPSTQYTDSSVAAGDTYYYVVTSVNSSNTQSGFSGQVVANVPAQ
jgi:hypothetical protein